MRAVDTDSEGFFDTISVVGRRRLKGHRGEERPAATKTRVSQYVFSTIISNDLSKNINIEFEASKDFSPWNRQKPNL
jgi:hypothetical protein